MSKTLSAKNRPGEFLGIDPAIETDDDLDIVLYEMSYLNAVNQSVDARINELIEAAKEENEQRKVIHFGEADDQKVTIQKRIEQLEALAKKYCKSNKKKMISGTKKTKKFPHGSISFNKQRDAVSYKKGVDVEESLSLLDQLLKNSLVVMLVGWMKSMVIFSKDKEARHLYEVIELKPRFNFTKLKDAYDEQRLTDEHLDQLGLMYYKGTDKIVVKPAAYDPG